jgi:Tfp pilus assembly protein PilO
MKITKRERRILVITITAIVLGVNYLLILPLVRSWGDTGRKLSRQQRELSAMKATIEHIPQWQKEYDELKRNLGQQSERFEHTSDVVKKIEQIRSSTGVIVNSVRQLPEEDKGVYRVLPVQCTIEATTEPLVKFLFALQTGAGLMSVEQLRITPKAENPSILRCDIQVRALAGKSGASHS